MATYRTEQARDKRTDVSAYPAESRTPETAENPEKADTSVHAFHGAKEKPNTRAHARPTERDLFDEPKPAGHRPVPFSRVVHRGTSAEADWNGWLADRSLPDLSQIGLRTSDREGSGFDMPWKFPPPAHDPERTEQAERFAFWLVNQRHESLQPSPAWSMRLTGSTACHRRCKSGLWQNNPPGVPDLHRCAGPFRAERMRGAKARHGRG